MEIPTFRTAVVRVPNGPDSIEVIDMPVVDPGPGRIRVAVAAATVNPTDLGVAAGFFHSIGLIDQPEHTGLAGSSPASWMRADQGPTGLSAPGWPVWWSAS
ncbi:NADP-dependent oxidoreductase, partial [Streptomyces sp. NPDC002784]